MRRRTVVTSDALLAEQFPRPDASSPNFPFVRLFQPVFVWRAPVSVILFSTLPARTRASSQDGDAAGRQQASEAGLRLVWTTARL